MITYQHEPRALCTRRRVYLVDDLDSGRPDLPFVLTMCVYAGAVLNHRLPGPYRESDARAFARTCLIPREILETPRARAWNVDTLSQWLGVPVAELLQALDPTCERRSRVRGIRRHMRRM